MIEKITYINFAAQNKSLKKTSEKQKVNVPIDRTLHGRSLFEALKDYNYASKFYNQNLNENKPVVTDLKVLNSVLSDSKASKNLYLYLSKRAGSEIAVLNSKSSLTASEKDKLIALKEIANAFPKIEDYIPTQKPISFKGEINPTQKRNCHIAIHGASAACGALSGAMGEGAAVGADTPFLWGAQGLMFLGLKKVLDVDHSDHIFYIARQLMMGQVLGVKGAKLLISWLGIGGHFASGGTASALITPAVQAVNGTLSAGITEKMGWGYVSACENDRMTWKKQALQTAIYAVGMGVFGHGTDSVLDAADPDNIKTAMDAVPKENVYTYGKVLKGLMDTIHLDRFGFMFTAQIAEKVLFNTNGLTKDELKNSLKIALMNTAIYDLIDYEYGQTIEDTTIVAVKQLEQELKQNPEVFAEFVKSQQELFDKLDMDKIDTAEFIKQFKDKKFVYNLSMMSGELSRQIADKWRKRNFAETLEKGHKLNEKGANVAGDSRGINLRMTPEMEEALKLSMEESFKKTIEKISSTSSNTCMNKVAGYDDVIKNINKIFINPLRNKDIANVPSSILFYGPTGTGKTSIGVAITESVGAKMIQKQRKPLAANAPELLNWLKEKANAADELYKLKQKHTIIQINEMGSFKDATDKEVEDFLSFIKDCAQKHHMTIFFTTNEPLTIDKELLDQMKKVPLGAASKEDMEAIIKLYLGEKKVENLDIKKIASEIDKVKPNNAYSNSQIADIIASIPVKSKITQDQLVTRILGESPAISNESLNKFDKEVIELSH